MSRYISNVLRKQVVERADHCCEYCKIRETESFFAFEIDHIISRKYGGETTFENLAYSCFTCNNYKGSDIGTALLPNREFIRLFDPRNDTWESHFEIEDGVVIPKTKIGEATVKVLKLNDVDRIVERRLLAS